jgi:hypothetical protein
MSNTNTGGPAFPVADPFAVKCPRTDADALRLQQGMTLRDYFATKATNEIFDVSLAHAKQLVGRECPIYIEDPKGFAEFWADCRAVLRYIEADAMLKAREA